ncbi:MAG: very short patch repair endonuclease [Erysipelotrichaceae bacterium]
MNDRISKEHRSWNMSRIKGKDTSLEIKVRKYLWHHGYRYRKNYHKLPGKPDIVLTKYDIIIFINGCFWHHHNCQMGYIPKTNNRFWTKKLQKNRDNDLKNIIELQQRGYYVITVWECELKDDFESRMKELIDEIENHISTNYMMII